MSSLALGLGSRFCISFQVFQAIKHTLHVHWLGPLHAANLIIFNRFKDAISRALQIDIVRWIDHLHCALHTQLDRRAFLCDVPCLACLLEHRRQTEHESSMSTKGGTLQTSSFSSCAEAGVTAGLSSSP